AIVSWATVDVPTSAFPLAFAAKPRPAEADALRDCRPVLRVAGLIVGMNRHLRRHHRREHHTPKKAEDEAHEEHAEEHHDCTAAFIGAARSGTRACRGSG